jgi:tetratricopeptide (TPR) repeat protein
MALWRQGDLVELTARCKDTLDRTRQQHSEPHASVAEALADMAFAHHEACDFESAANCNKDRLEIEKTLNGERSAQYVDCLVSLARSYVFSGRDSAAEIALEHAQKLVNCLPEDAFPRSTVLINLALLHARRKDDSRVEQLLMQTVKLCLKEFNWAHPRYGIVFDHLSRLYWRQGKKRAALRSIRKAIRIFREANEVDSPYYAMMLSWEGVVLADLDQLTEAKLAHQASLQILARTRPQGHQEIKKVKERLAIVEGQMESQKR